MFAGNNLTSVKCRYKKLYDLI